MNIYVDFDDCLCETARHFSDLVEKLFGKRIQYENIRSFNLQDSFLLTDAEYEKMMVEAHTPEVLLSLEETPEASSTVNGWIDKGHDVFIITGRPLSAYEASREWLDEHRLERAKLFCLNKYGRDSFIKNSDFSLEIDDYLRMRFDYAIEDSPAAFGFFGHMPQLKVLVFNRPWNRGCELPGTNYSRVSDWRSIKDLMGL